MHAMTMKLVAVGMLSGGLLLAGCTQQARRIDPQGTQTITTVNELDIQDATDAAAELSQSLLASGQLGRGGEPSIIAIDRYVNNTGEHIDRDAVIKKIRVSLNKAGVARTLVTIDPTGALGGESDIASRAAYERGAEWGHRTVTPDYALTFKILDNRTRAGDVRQTTYIFQMSLVDVATGLAVWEDEKQITKQGEKPAVGW
jgi:hypothetical protein